MLLLNQDAETTGISIMVQDRSYYVLQEEGIIRMGKTCSELNVGDTVYIAPEIKHWHGAAPESYFVHIAESVPNKMLQTSGLKQWMKKNI